jgi:hypothetical protein
MTNKLRLGYRKNLRMDGSLLIGTSEIRFFTKNVSLKGFHACCPKAENLEEGDIVYVRLPLLSMEGVASTIWKGSDLNGICHMGFKFLKMRGTGGSAYHYRESEQRIWSR